MRVVAIVAGVILIALMLLEFFLTFLLPRRVKRDPRIARQAFRMIWRPWRAIAMQLPNKASSDTMLGIFGPFGLVLILALWSLGLIVGFTLITWGAKVHFTAGAGEHIGNYLYFSAGSFFSASTPLSPSNSTGKMLQVFEAAAGFGVLFIAIGYLPSLFQAFSRREIAVSQLDPRAGSPPCAGALLIRSAPPGNTWQELDGYLAQWETWATELMETHLSYPIIGYFRSQHINQNWVSALTAIVDTSAFAIAYAPKGEVQYARFTFAIGRHALADLAHSYGAKVPTDMPDRLPDQQLEILCNEVTASGLQIVNTPAARDIFRSLQSRYERNASAVANLLALTMPQWLPPDDVIENWRVATPAGHSGSTY